jgi:hypothetical protein
VSAPFSAPACPPETGASTKAAPPSRAAADSSRATAAEAVVWSTKTAPDASAPNAPSGPSVTARRSSSFPTHAKTISAPSAAAAGVGADRCPCFDVQASARDALRLNTVTWWPAAARCPAMGKPITPSPMNAT